MSYQDFAAKSRSQKILLAHLQAKQKVKLFELVSGSVYKKKTAGYVVEVKVNGSYLTLSSDNNPALNEFYYDSISGYLFINIGSDPRNSSVYLTYRFFFSNLPIDLPANITSGEVVHYDSRVKAIGNLKLELDYEATGIALETSSSISLDSNDGYFVDLFDGVIWENNQVKFWSYNKALPSSEAKLIYRGLINEKSYTPTEVRFSLKDELSKLRQTIQMPRFSELDGHLENTILGKPKRLILGRVDQMPVVGIDKVLDGFTLMGTLTGSADRNLLDGTVSGLFGSDTLNGLDTLFLTQLAIDDKIKVIGAFNEYSFTVESIISNTSLVIKETLPATFNGYDIRNLEILNNVVTGTATDFINQLSPNDNINVVVDGAEYEYTVAQINSSTEIILDDEIEVSFIDATVTNEPEIAYRRKNRRHSVAGHKLREYSVEVVTVLDGTNIEVDDINDIEAGDYLRIGGFTYVVIRTTLNQIRLNQSLRTVVAAGDLVTKLPVQAVYADKKRYIIDRDFSVINDPDHAVIQFSELAEFNVAPTKNPNIQFEFTLGSNLVNSLSATVDLTTVFKPRDFVKARSLNLPDWYEILSVSQTQLVLRSNAVESFSGNIQHKSPEYISDSSLVLVNCLGLESNSEWIRYPANSVKWIIESIGLTDINTSSFEIAKNDCLYDLSLFYPRSIGSEMPIARDMITDINRSVFGSLYLDNSFLYTYKVYNADRPADLSPVKDEDIIKFSVTTKSNIINSIILNYSPYTDLDTGSDATRIISLESDFVNEAVEKVESLEVTSYIYKESNAQNIAERWLFFRSLTQSVVSIDAKLNFAGNSLNDVLMLDLSRLYKRFGSPTYRKVGIINSISKTADSTQVQINDLGNVYSRVPSIAPDTEGDYLVGSESVDKYGYILDNVLETPTIDSELELESNLIG
jgi:hypothetical protein